MASRNRKNYKPLVMWLILSSGIIAVIVARSSRAIGVWRKGAFNWDTVFIGLYVLWMVIELRVSRKDISTEGKKTSDFATCRLYGAGQALMLCTGMHNGPFLDIGCGSLAFTADSYRLYSKRPMVLAGRSLKMLRMAKEKLLRKIGRIPKNVCLLHADALHLPFTVNRSVTIKV